MIKFQTRQKAFSLIETMTALVIISLSFVSAFSLFGSVTKNGNVGVRLKAKWKIDEYVATVKQQREFNNEVLGFQGFVLESKYALFHGHKDVIEMYVLTKNTEGKKLIEHHELIYNAQ